MNITDGLQNRYIYANRCNWHNLFQLVNLSLDISYFKCRCLKFLLKCTTRARTHTHNITHTGDPLKSVYEPRSSPTTKRPLFFMLFLISKASRKYKSTPPHPQPIPWCHFMFSQPAAIVGTV